ncbi:MAG: PEP-CTERM sorting domain-containing protein, partial [Chthoniobacteraceae bacterium]
ISSGTVNATAGTSLSNGSSLAVNGTLGGGAVTTGSGSVLSGTGTITSTLTVSAGGVTSPGVGNKTGVMTTDLSYDGGSMANFNVATTGSAGTPQALNSHLFYSQMIVTGTAGQVNLGIGTGVSLQSQTVGQIQTSGNIGSSNSGVTLQLSLSSTDYNTLVSNASSDYNAKSANSTLDNYFVFNLGTGLTAGRFETLALDVDGTTTSGLIYYAGTNDRFAADGVDNTIGDVYVIVNGVKQEFALSYTGNFADGANATIGGHDIVLTAIPEPGTWGMILGGFGMLIGFQRLRKRRVS